MHCYLYFCWCIMSWGQFVFKIMWKFYLYLVIWSVYINEGLYFVRQLPPYNFPRLLRYQVINEQSFEKRNVKFSLTDSLCLEECQKQLRSIYETNSTVKIVPWDQSSAVHIDKVYTQLSWLMDLKDPSGWMFLSGNANQIFIHWVQQNNKQKETITYTSHVRFMC